MSKLRCQCGYLICDNTSSLPYKASILKDLHCESFSDWLVSELQSYVTAAEQGNIREWLLSRDYSEEYIALQLDHGNVLYDHLHGQFLTINRTAYECSACGRIHVETVEDNRFVSYTPDSKKCNGVMRDRVHSKSNATRSE